MAWRLLIVCVALVLTGCSTSAELTPRDVLLRATAASDGLNTVHFSLQQQNGSLELAAGVRITDAQGDVAGADRLQMRFTMLLGGGLSAEDQLIAVGADRFVTNPVTGLWLASALNRAAPHFLDRDRGISTVLRNIDSPRGLGNEVLDADQTLHLQGTLLTSTFADMLDCDAATDVVAAEVWIGADDFLLRQLRLVGPIDVGDTDSTVRALRFSHFNEPVAIDRPRNTAENPSRCLATACRVPRPILRTKFGRLRHGPKRACRPNF